MRRRIALRFEQYEPAYALGVDAYDRNPGHDFDNLESHLSRVWPAAQGASTLDWERASLAARDGWVRLSNTDARRHAGA